MASTLRTVVHAILGTLLFLLPIATLSAQHRQLTGIVRDETGAALPGVLVELRGGSAAVVHTYTDERGRYAFDTLAPGTTELSFTLVNFATVRRPIRIGNDAQPIDAVMHLVLSADVTVTGKSTFTNLADAPDPSQDLVGIAQSASQGAVTARQLDTRPIMRPGDVLETVPGVVISQHSGEGKANQYYLRGFNLDHGTDFATTVAGMPVNMPTHGHGHGYSDLNFLIPELASGVQFSKGPYFAEHGDFATAGTANINYTNTLARPIVRVGGGNDALRTRAGRGGADCRQGHAPRRARGRAQRRPVGTARRLAQVQRVDSVHARRCAQRPVSDGDGLSRDVELDRSDPDARGGRRSHRPIRPGRLDRWRKVVALQRLPRVAAQQWERQHHAQRLRPQVRPRPVLELHLLPRRPRERRSVPADRSPLRERRATHPPPDRPVAGPADAEYRRRPVQERQHQRHRPVSHARAGAARDNPPGFGAPDEHRRLRAERNRVDAVAADARRRARRRLSLRRQRRHHRERRYRLRGTRQPQRRRGLWTVRKDRGLRQRRPRLPQQRRARRDDHRRSGDRRTGQSRDAARARDRRRNRHQNRAHPPPADDASRRGRSGSIPSSCSWATQGQQPPAGRAAARESS